MTSDKLRRIYISKDAAAISVGADQIASELAKIALARGDKIEITRCGSRGILWAEPMIEVESEPGRFGYRNISLADLPSLIDQGMLENSAKAKSHPLALGLIESLPWMKNQTRQIFRRSGLADPLDFSAYQKMGGLVGLDQAIKIGSAAIVQEITHSGLRGRGGAGFPTGIKWKTVRDTAAEQKYIVCNADEGDSGTFADRILMEGDPFTLIEGMVIAGTAVGATQGFVYIRSEYPHAFATMQAAIIAANSGGLLGANLRGSNYAFQLEARLGAGAYICGEETSLLESLEGKRGVIRYKPPLPAIKGLFGQPTVINNVLSLAAVPEIMAQGADSYRAMGVGRSLGTLAVQLGGNIKRGGLIEVPFGITLNQLINDFGGGTATGRPVRAVQVGGPLGAYFPPSLFDVPLDYEDYAKHGGMVGHGGIVVFDESVNMAKQARFAMQFCAEESCGKCTPCRIGSTRGVEVIDRIINKQERDKNLKLLNDLCTLMKDSSLCALGGLTPMPVQSALIHFGEDF